MNSLRKIVCVTGVHIFIGVGCSDEDPATNPSDVELCDGSSSLRFAQKDNYGGQLSEPYEQYATTQNGTSTVLVNGQCRYWVSRPGLEGTVSGTLSEEDALAFEESVLMERYGELVGRIWGTACPDCASSEISNGEERFAYWPVVDGIADLEVIATNVHELKRELFENGSPIAGDLRCHLSQLSEADAAASQWQSQPWRAPPEGLDLSLARPQIPVDGVFDISVLRSETFVARGQLADDLRAIRSELASDSDEAFVMSYIPLAAEDGGRYLLFARDVLPFENQDGFIDFGRPATLKTSKQ